MERQRVELPLVVPSVKALDLEIARRGWLPEGSKTSERRVKFDLASTRSAQADLLPTLRPNSSYGAQAPLLPTSRPNYSRAQGSGGATVSKPARGQSSKNSSEHADK